MGRLDVLVNEELQKLATTYKIS